MRRYLFALLAFALLLSPAKAADSTVTAMTAAGALGGTELTYCVQGGADRKCTVTQVTTFVYSQASGDFTCTGPGVCTVTKTNGSPFSTLATTTPGTGVATALGVNVGSAGAFVTFNGALGTPSSGTMTNVTGLPISTGVSGLGTGIATWLATPSSANLFAALTTKTGSGGSAVFATGPTVSALTLSDVATGTQCLHANGSGVVSGTGADCASGGSVTSITPGAALVSSITAACSQTAITVTGTLSGAECVNAQTGTSYAIVDGDRGKLVTGNNASAQAYTIAQAGAGSAFVTGWYVDLFNKGAGTLTLTPTTSTINGAATYTLFAGQGVRIASDGTNYQINPGSTGGVQTSTQSGANYPFAASDFGKIVYLSNGSNQVPTIAQAGTVGFSTGWYVTACNIAAGSQTITPTTSTIGGAATYVLRAGSAAVPTCINFVSDGTNYLIVPESPALGANVATALAAALSAAGGVTTTIASGTSALGTSAIASAACATVVTTSATNTATTDVVLASFNGDPTAVTGYVPATSGMLTIISYPTTNNVNFKVCNNTASSITPGAITLNWRVLR